MPSHLLKSHQAANMKSKTLLMCSTWLCGMFLTSSAGAQAVPADVQQALAVPFVVVNGQAQPTAYAEVLFRERMAKGAASSPALRDAVRDELVDQTLIMQAAQAEGLDRHPLVQAQMSLASRAALNRLWQQKYLSEHPITDAALQAEYKQQMALLGTEELMLRHIIVTDEALAKSLIQRVEQGATLAELAAQYSSDPDSKTQGGLVGWVSLNQLVPEVAKVVRQMRPQQLWSAPVSTAQGWHVIYLQERRALVPPELDKIRPQLLELIAQKAITQKLQTMRQSATVQ
jgi:peptidyl-prolyl cis-trans isomerase C